jgi:4-amino-4-deoxy-L-arabinose transferase-like glycosyltransferase
MTVLWTAINVVWLLAYRRGYTVNVDEAAYLGAVWDDTTGLQHGGPLGLWHAWVGRPDVTPLVPLSALPFQLVFGTHPLAAFLALDVWLGVLLVSVAGLARRLMNPRWAVVCVVVVGCVPAVVDESRDFVFALPAAALLAAVAAALLNSAHLQHRRWAATLGVLLGLMPLARSMTVAFIPGVIAAMALAVYASPSRRRAATNAAMALVISAAVALTWFGPNLTFVATYLLSVGYGKELYAYAKLQLHTPFEPTWWTSRAKLIVNTELGLPLTVLVIAGLIACAVIAIRARRGGRLRAREPGVLAGAVCLVIVVEAYLALSSSATPGSSFELPLLPFVVLLAIAGLSRLRGRHVRVLLLVALLAAAAIGPVAKSGVVAALGRPVLVELPIVGTTLVVDGRSTMTRYVDQWPASTGDQASAGPQLAPLDRLWTPATARLESAISALARAHGRLPIVCFATRDGLVSTNHVGFAGRYWNDRPPFPVAQLVPPLEGAALPTYVSRLTDPRFGWPNILITGDPSTRDFDPPVNMGEAAAAARLTGFVPAFEFTLPDGRRLEVWWLERGPVLGAPVSVR